LKKPNTKKGWQSSSSGKFKPQHHQKKEKEKKTYSGTGIESKLKGTAHEKSPHSICHMTGVLSSPQDEEQ
jgi:hypothetical protein